MTKQQVHGRLVPDPERLRLLEALAEAIQVYARTWQHGDCIGMTFAEYLSARGRYIGDNCWIAVLEALAALEALDEKEQP